VRAKIWFRGTDLVRDGLGVSSALEGGPESRGAHAQSRASDAEGVHDVLGGQWGWALLAGVELRWRLKFDQELR
jgi:hypothetical protein